MIAFSNFTSPSLHESKKLTAYKEAMGRDKGAPCCGAGHRDRKFKDQARGDQGVIVNMRKEVHRAAQEI